MFLANSFGFFWLFDSKNVKIPIPGLILNRFGHSHLSIFILTAIREIDMHGLDRSCRRAMHPSQSPLTENKVCVESIQTVRRSEANQIGSLHSHNILLVTLKSRVL